MAPGENEFDTPDVKEKRSVSLTNQVMHVLKLLAAHQLKITGLIGGSHWYQVNTLSRELISKTPGSPYVGYRDNSPKSLFSSVGKLFFKRDRAEGHGRKSSFVTKYGTALWHTVLQRQG